MLLRYIIGIEKWPTTELAMSLLQRSDPQYLLSIIKCLEAGVAQTTNNGRTFFITALVDGSSGVLRVLPASKNDGGKVALEVFSDTATSL